MPVSQTAFPILLQFFCAVAQTTGMPPQPLDEEKGASNDGGVDTTPKKLPKGIVLGADGKPYEDSLPYSRRPTDPKTYRCRSCTSFASWAAMTKQQTTSPSKVSTTTPPAGATSSLSQPENCPPDVEALGRSSWTLLHSITATYPTAPSPELQKETKSFLSTFSKLYPCWVCAEDFQKYIASENAPKVNSRDEFGKWMCEAHNAVNVKLGKERFDCNRWEERWRTGWKDGGCD
ncbi:hypothetical protein LTS18_011741 [Coniosporium uncinatum]|uniref:Uncharacterized protein n=1 Tax=Coniosporium uncinatum TaxID=93489 RepID=A0ACC3DW69_9PEZI|nr:hypothetical protein LTS18_011741 [Coniosporium uncinatum]